MDRAKLLIFAVLAVACACFLTLIQPVDAPPIGLLYMRGQPPSIGSTPPARHT